MAGTNATGAASTEVDVCILGAGPHGLAAAIHLRLADPDLKVAVLDRSGGWLSTWRQQFARAEITTLRSPVVHHPSPDPYALAQFMDDAELEPSGLPYNIPTTDAFEQFCDALVAHHAIDDPLAVAPSSIHSDARSVQLDCGETSIAAQHLVIATNPYKRPLPEWIWPLLGQKPGLVRHGYDVDLAALPHVAGEQILIVGGGLTAAHLALGAARRGAHVKLASRRNLSVRSFDTAPGWLGPKYLDSFDAEPDPARRLAMAGRARSGGSIPGWIHERLTSFSGPGSIDLCESTVVQGGHLDPASGNCELRLSDGQSVQPTHLWLATGTQPEAEALRCIRPLLDDVASLHGLPIVDERLRLGPHPAYVMGRLATVALGPAAGNLWGAQRAADRITQAITGVDLTCRAIGAVRPPALF